MESALPEEVLSQEELVLADRLRSCCANRGVERKSKLHESSATLLEMGKFYLKKAKQLSGMLQKLTFIKCAALIAGAKVRFEKHSIDVTKATEASRDFEEMCEVLLSICNDGRESRVNLLGISNEISALLHRLREKESSFMEEYLSPIQTSVSEAEFWEKQKDVVKNVRYLLKRNTDDYKAMMTDISKKCVRILGKPPCSFCLAGLGSLAREEVTLYSDFEHIILLEDEVDDSPNGKIREYFRWYSVIFQVIIIGLGETFIPTVGVKSLNDLYSEDKSKDWYFDCYTPGGVSFDGRFPHSCKTPLGTQESTKSHDQVVELIQPVNIMLKYLSEQESLGKAYHLRDVLMRTCYLDGEEDLHDKFRAAIPELVEKQSRDQEVKEQVLLLVANTNIFLRNYSEAQHMHFSRLKDFFYRPIMLITGCLARLCRRYPLSNFDFCDWFRANMQFTSIEEIEFALALANKIRLKFYSKFKLQKQRVSPKMVCKLEGRTCVTRYLRVTTKCVEVFHHAAERNSSLQDTFRFLDAVFQQRESDSELDNFALFLFGFHEDAVKNYSQLGVKSAVGYFGAGYLISNREYMDEGRKISQGGASVGLTFDYVTIWSQIYFDQERYGKCLDLVAQWVDLCKNRDTDIKLDDPRFLQIQYLKSLAILKCKTPTESAALASRVIAEYKELYRKSNGNYTFLLTQAMFLITLSKAQFQLYESSKARKPLLAALPICNAAGSVDQLKWQMIMMGIIVSTQRTQGWNEDATQTLANLEIVRDTEDWDVIVEEFCDIGMTGIHKTLIDVMSRPSASKHTPVFYERLKCAVLTCYKKNMNASFGQLCHCLMDVLSNSSNHFGSPYFFPTFRTLTVIITAKSIDMKSAMEGHARAFSRPSSEDFSRVFNKALERYRRFDIKSSASLLWREINTGNHRELNDKCSKLLVHILTLASSVRLLHFLQIQRRNFIELNTFQPVCAKTVRFNAAFYSFINFELNRAASGFWETILSTKSNTKLHHRATEMLMYVVLLKRESGGFPMTSSPEFIVNQSAKDSVFSLAGIGDLCNALLLSADDTQKAVRQAGLIM